MLFIYEGSFFLLILFLRFDRDEVAADLLAVSQFILVDHHNNAKVRDRVIEVIDHRPFDATSALPLQARQTIQEVGSCCTLIANRILCNDPQRFADILELLYPVILLDTVNFSVDADKAKELDLSVVNRIEKMRPRAVEDRTKIFDDLVAARADISRLNAYEVLWKDLKFVTGSSGRNVGIPGLPIAIHVG